MKFYECKHYKLVEERNSCYQYHACTKELDKNGKKYAFCKGSECELLKSELKTLAINELVQKAHENASRKGFWEDWYDIKGNKKHKKIEVKEGHAEDNLINNAIGNRLMLIVGEIAEAQEALRKKDYDNFAEELADVAIRLGDLCGGLDIDLEAEIIKKMEKNKDRPYKHGKSF